MLLHDAGLAWLHFIFAFVLVGAIVAEAFILRLPIDSRVARLLLRVDLFYGISSVLIILAGVSRVIWGAKGWDYYQAQPFFWAKIATFGVIGLLSIGPTRTFMGWMKSFNADPGFTPAEAEVKRMRGVVVAEAHLVVFVLLFASLMARGVWQG